MSKCQVCLDRGTYIGLGSIQAECKYCDINSAKEVKEVQVTLKKNKIKKRSLTEELSVKTDSAEVEPTTVPSFDFRLDGQILCESEAKDE